MNRCNGYWHLLLGGLLALMLVACGGGGGVDDKPTEPTLEASASFSQQNDGLTVTFDAGNSSGTIASYLWDFGDGSTGTGKSTSHSYAVAGSYTVTLTVSDEAGASARQSLSVHLTKSNITPTAAFSYSAGGLLASFDASGSSDSDGSIASYSWNFGDGTTGTGKSASHSYGATGTYTVTLTVTDDLGATASQSVSVTVVSGNVAPTAAFTQSTSGLVASFDASGSSDSDGSIARYSWNFGDGTTGTGKSTNHTYAAAGTYTVSLTVTDNLGVAASQSASVSVVKANVAPVASFIQSAAELVASFDASGSSDSDGSIASYSWSFGDGTTGTGKSTNHTYAVAGTYTVSLTVTDNQGTTASVSRSITVAVASYRVSVQASGQGTVLPSGLTLSAGQSGQVTVTPASGYLLASISGCGGALQGSIYTTGAISGNCVIIASFQPQGSIVFADAVLDAAVRKALVAQIPGFTLSTPITGSMLDGVTALDLDAGNGQSQIRDLSGLELFHNLTRLSVADHKVSNLAPLAGLDKLSYLNLTGNDVVDLSPLRSLTALQQVYLDATEINTLDGLENSAALTTVSATWTPLTSLKGLLTAGWAEQGTLLLDFNCLYLGSGSYPQKELASLAGLGVTIQGDSDTYSIYGNFSGLSCPDSMASFAVQSQVSLGSTPTLDYRLDMENYLNADALSCDLYVDLIEQQARVPVQTITPCDPQALISLPVSANGNYTASLVIRDGYGGSFQHTLPAIRVTTLGAQPHIRAVDWGQVVVTRNPQLIAARNALLRVHVTSDVAPSVPPDLTMKLTLNGTTQTIAMTKPTAIPAQMDYENIAASYRAVVPASMMQPGLQVTVSLPNGDQRVLTPSFATTPTFYLTLVPMRVGGLAVTMPPTADVQRALKSFWPMQSVQIKQHAVFTPVATSGDALLDEVTDLQAIENDPTYFYGIYSSEVDNYFAGVGWMGLNSAIGYDSTYLSDRCKNVGGDYLCVMAHELGHNFNIGHIGCGTDNMEPKFPYDFQSIGSLGVSFDLSALYKPTEYRDLMSYCGPQHISDFTFEAVQDYLARTPSAPFPTSKSRARVAESSEEGLFISGSLLADGTIKLQRVLPLARPVRSLPSSALVATVTRSDGQQSRVNVQLMTASQESAEPQAQHFQLEIPFSDLTALSIAQGGKELFTQAVSLAAASRSKTAVAPTLQEQGDELCVQWQAGDFDGVTLMQVAEDGQQTVLTLQNPDPAACVSLSGVPNGGHWRLLTRAGLLTQQLDVVR